MAFERIRAALSARTSSVVLSYRALRRLIGVLGLALPFACMAGGWLFARRPLQGSISRYYFTNMGDLLVGTLFAVSMFLVTYKGHQVIDVLVSIATGVAGLGIAAFPCLEKAGASARVGIFNLPPALSDALHLACAGAFFVLLSLTSLFLFTKTKPGAKTLRAEKRNRNRVYIVCGLLMLLSMLGMVLGRILLGPEALDASRITLLLETVLLVSFGVSWLVKGETLFRDKPGKGANAYAAA